jgi:hypothetical protein
MIARIECKNIIVDIKAIHITKLLIFKKKIHIMINKVILAIIITNSRNMFNNHLNLKVWVSNTKSHIKKATNIFRVNKRHHIMVTNMVKIKDTKSKSGIPKNITKGTNKLTRRQTIRK